MVMFECKFNTFMMSGLRDFPSILKTPWIPDCSSSNHKSIKIPHMRQAVVVVTDVSITYYWNSKVTF